MTVGKIREGIRKGIPQVTRKRVLIFFFFTKIEANYKQINEDKSSDLEISINLFSCCLMEFKSPTFNSFETCSKILNFFLSLITALLPLHLILEQFKLQ